MITFDYTPHSVPTKTSKERNDEFKNRQELINLAANRGDDETCERLKRELKLYKSLWRSPNTAEFPVLKLVAEALGGYIGVDVVADKDCLVPARHHITAEDDFLHPLTDITDLGPAYMNCDYANPKKFLYKLWSEYNEDHVNQAIALCKAGVVANQGTGAIIRNGVSAACFWGAGKISPFTGKPLKRLAFIDVDGFLVEGSDFDTVFLYFGVNPTLFINTFKHYGSVWIPV